MSKPKNLKLYEKKTTKINKTRLNSTVRSQLEASKRYDEKFEFIKIRVPVGYKEKLKNIAETNSTSINSLLMELIKEKFEL